MRGKAGAIGLWFNGEWAWSRGFFRAEDREDSKQRLDVQRESGLMRERLGSVGGAVSYTHLDVYKRQTLN